MQNAERLPGPRKTTVRGGGSRCRNPAEVRVSGTPESQAFTAEGGAFQLARERRGGRPHPLTPLTAKRNQA
jgi:hypothetical protein